MINLSNIQIPIVIDDIKNYKTFNWIRATYFSIECDTPSPGWQLGIGNATIPFLMIGLSGIIYQPHDGSDKFDSPQKIENLFNAIEDFGRVFIDINDIYLPNSYIRVDGPMRGAVFRIPFNAFDSALKYKNGFLGKDQFEKQCKNFQSPSFEGKETDSIKKWGRVQIKEARAIYHHNPNQMRLKRI